ncbi:MAG: copper chaperone PCu(A)C [Motiliproteus sp.]|nr:copper chaperone PCu(A)C [Motiliproteus sp.]MCW9052549.1 copper chaperone PCu(A)C [Motiliproteus sp.]
MKKLMPLALSLLSAAVFAEVQISDGYVRATPPGAPTSAAFMTLNNSDGKAVELLSAQSQVARSTELHTVKHEDGTMKMRQVKNITVPAEGSVELKPGSYHVMLIGLEKGLKEGDEVMLMLNFSDGTMQHLMLPVIKPGTGKAMAGGEMKHHHH